MNENTNNLGLPLMQPLQRTISGFCYSKYHKLKAQKTLELRDVTYKDIIDIQAYLMQDLLNFYFLGRVYLDPISNYFGNDTGKIKIRLEGSGMFFNRCSPPDSQAKILLKQTGPADNPNQELHERFKRLNKNRKKIIKKLYEAQQNRTLAIEVQLAKVIELYNRYDQELYIEKDRFKNDCILDREKSKFHSKLSRINKNLKKEIKQLKTSASLTETILPFALNIISSSLKKHDNDKKLETGERKSKRSKTASYDATK